MKVLTYRLEDIANKFVYGSMPKSELLVENGYPIYSGYRYVGYYPKYNIASRSIVVVARGVGGTGDVKIVDGKTFLTNLSIALDINQELADIDYLYYYLNAQGLRYLDTGAAQSQITITNLKKHKVFLPSLPIQRRVASILSTYDNLIENNTRRIRLLEQMAENLYKEWFVRFRFPGHEKAEFENGLPKGWKIEKLGNIASISTGKCNREDAEEDGQYPLFDRSQEIKKSSEWLKDCEAIIVPGEGTSFVPRYYWGKFNLHQRCYCVEPTIKNIGKFLFYMLMLNRKYFLSVATGATVPSLRYNNFAKMKFVMPNIHLCEEYNEIASNLFKMMDTLKSENTFLSRQRDLLLPRLMSGKLEVKG